MGSTTRMRDKSESSKLGDQEDLKRLTAELEESHNRLQAQARELAGRNGKLFRTETRSRSVEADRRETGQSRTKYPGLKRERSLQDIDKDIETIWRELQEWTSCPRTARPRQQHLQRCQSSSWSPHLGGGLQEQFLNNKHLLTITALCPGAQRLGLVRSLPPTSVQVPERQERRSSHRRPAALPMRAPGRQAEEDREEQAARFLRPTSQVSRAGNRRAAPHHQVHQCHPARPTVTHQARG